MLILVGLTSCQKSKNEVIVKGKFIGDLPKEVKYSIPINGICYGFFQATERVDSLGNFELRVNIESPSIIEIFSKGNTYNLIVEPRENYKVTIESNNVNSKFTAVCKNTSIQSIYQNLASPINPSMEAMKFLNLPTSIVHNKIDSVLNSEVLTFSDLLNNNVISKELFDLIKLDRTLFYSCVQGKVSMIKFFNARVKDNKANTDSINQMWNESISSVPLNSSTLLRSKWAYYYLENYLMCLEYTAKDFSFDVRSKARNEGMIHTYLIGIAKKYLNGKILEFYTSSYILSTTKQNKFEKELIGLFEELKTEFPKSKYATYIEPQIEKVIDFNQKADLEFVKGTTFLDNFENLNTLAECLQPFKGKKVYVDLWSTSCGSCKDEFKHSGELAQLLIKNNVGMLYISLDREKAVKRWKDMIKYYKLIGYHVRANDALVADLKNILGSLWMPHYLLFDENGDIVNNDAKRPSEISDLEKQISIK